VNLGDLAGFITGGATLVLGGVTYLLARETRRAVNLTRADVTESRKTRIDATAPLVAFLATTHVERYPHLPVESDWTARDFVNRDVRWGGDTAPHVLYVSGTFLLINEGKATAVLTLPSGVTWTRSRSSFDEQTETEFTPEQRDYDTAFELLRATTMTLEPGQRGHLWVRAGQPVKTWMGAHAAALDQNPQGPQPWEADPISVTITATSTLADGVEDTTRLELRAFPLAPLKDNLWTVQRPTQVVLAACPTSRIYRGDAAPVPIPST